MCRRINLSRPCVIIFRADHNRAVMLIALLVVLGSSYLFFLIYAWQCADRIIFAVPPASYEDGPDYISVPAGDGGSLTCVHLVAPEAKITVLYLHGNGEDLGDVLPHLQSMRQQGISVFGFDYRGYGTTPGQPAEANLCADVQMLYRYLLNTARLSPAQIVVYGRSLGSGPGVYLAATERVGGLVLEGAFMSAFRVATQIPILPMDRFRNLARLQAVHCPVLVMHAVHDKTVPVVHGRRLFAAANEPKRCRWFEEVQHNDFARDPGEEYWSVLKAFFRDCEARVGESKAGS